MRKFKIGDKVKLNPGIKSFKYGRGDVEYSEIGKIKKFEGNEIKVDFPSLPYLWHGVEEELIKSDFTKSDLEEGDIVVLRNNEKLIFEGYRFKDLDFDPRNLLSDINDLNDDLTFRDHDEKDSDIVKVIRINDSNTIFNRTEVKEMTIKEISEELGYEVKIIKEEK